MPLYDFQCEQGHRFERSVKLRDFEAQQFCACSVLAKRLISAPRFTVDHTGYRCPVTDKWIGSGVAHRENLARQDCRVLETGENEAAAKRRQDDDTALDRKIEDTVERTIDSYSSAKKEQLHNELVNGRADLSVERG